MKALAIVFLLTLQSTASLAEPATWDAATIAECTKYIKQVQLYAAKERIRLLKTYSIKKHSDPIPEVGLIREHLGKLLTPERRARLESLRAQIAQGWNSDLKKQLSDEFEQVLAPVNQQFAFRECPKSPKPKKGQTPLPPLTQFSLSAYEDFGLLVSDAKTQTDFQSEVANRSALLYEQVFCPSTPDLQSNQANVARRARHLTAIYNPVTQQFEVLIRNLDSSVRSDVLGHSDIQFTSSFDLLDSKSPAVGSTWATALSHPYVSLEFNPGNAILNGDTDRVIERLDKHGMLGALKCGTYYKLRILGRSKGASPSSDGGELKTTTGRNLPKDLSGDSFGSEQPVDNTDSSAKGAQVP